MRTLSVKLSVAAVMMTVMAALASVASALEVVLHDVAPDRVERQRAYARGDLPLAGTPNLDKLSERLSERGLAKGRAVYIRVFKEESELELWMQNSGGTFTLLATYPVCHWTGTIGPKLKEGDKQSPEGFYSVGVPQTRLVGRWRRAFNLGFPNLHDQLLSRTGSYILIHGGCSSVGCFAMTDQVQEEIYGLAGAALSSGQGRFQVHVFPFRMTEANLARRAEHEWAHTWADLKPAYDSFERTRVPPRVVLCGVRYKIADGLPGETGGSESRLPVLRPVAQSGQAADSAAVIDANGDWAPPACVLDDEERRKAAYTLTNAATSEVPGEDGERATMVASGQPSSTGGRQRKATKVTKTPTSSPGGSGKAQATDGSDGFGNAVLPNKERVTANGG